MKILISPLQCKNLAKTVERRYLNLEQSVLTLGSRVLSAYHTTYRIDRESKNKKKHILNLYAIEENY